MSAVPVWEMPPSVPVETSEDASDKIRPHLPRIRSAVLRRLHYVALTCDQIEEFTGFAHQTVGPRLRELADAGLIERTDERRPTRSGRDAFVWKITQNGLALLEPERAA